MKEGDTMQDNHETTPKNDHIDNMESVSRKDDSPQTTERPPKRLSIASTLGAISAALALVCTFWYLDAFRSMASSNFPDIGFVQLLSLGFFGFLIGICVLLTLVGFLCTIGLGKREAALAHLPLFVSLWTVGLFLSIHTVSVAGYIVATLMLFPLFYWLYRRKIDGEVQRKRLLIVSLACLVGIGVVVALALIVHQGILDDAVLRLLFFAM